MKLSRDNMNDFEIACCEYEEDKVRLRPHLSDANILVLEADCNIHLTKATARELAEFLLDFADSE